MSPETDTDRSLRRDAFFAAVVAVIAVSVTVLGQFLPHVVTGWTGAFGARSIYALVFITSTVTGLLGMAVQFYRPTERVTAILLMPAGLVLSAAIGLATGTIFAVVTLVLAAVSLVPLALHPAGRSLLRFERVASPNRLLVALYAAGAVVLVVYGGQELLKQFTRTGEDALRGHYGDLAIAAFSMVALGGLAVFRRRDWRFAAWATGFVGLYLGVGSAVFPAASSSLGLAGGVLVAVWAIAFVGVTERVRGGELEPTGALGA